MLTYSSFRKAAASIRGLIASDGYYEREKTADAKRIPTYLHGADEEPLASAALFENRPYPALPDGDPKKWLRTAAIIMTAASDAPGRIHVRTPLIVPPRMWTDWLDPGDHEGADVRALLDSYLVPRVVSNKVNYVRNNGPELNRSSRLSYPHAPRLPYRQLATDAALDPCSSAHRLPRN